MRILSPVGCVEVLTGNRLDPKPFVVDHFKKLKRIAFHEGVLNLFYKEQYSISIYLTLFKLKNAPNNKYYRKILGNNFSKLYKAKKSYKFNRYVDTINPKVQDESYIQFLSFLWNLRLDEIDEIAKYYLANNN